MVAKEELRLGQRVWYGADRLGAVVDGLTQTVVGLRLDEGGYVIVRYEDVYLSDGSVCR